MIFLKQLVDARADVELHFWKSWLLHRPDTAVSAARNLEMIAGSINTCDPKLVNRFFTMPSTSLTDLFRMRNATLDTLRAAHGAGADRLILCDTNGGMLPSQITDAVVRCRPVA